MTAVENRFRCNRIVTKTQIEEQMDGPRPFGVSVSFGQEINDPEFSNLRNDQTLTRARTCLNLKSHIPVDACVRIEN